MRFIYALLIVLASSSITFATHIIGGYIRTTPLAGRNLTYLVTATMYYRPEAGVVSAVNNLYICFGDKGAPVVVGMNTAQPSSVDKGVYVTEYKTIYTYSGPGVYTVQATAVTRSSAVNTKNSDQPFSMQTTFQVGTSVNSTPVLSLPVTGLSQGVSQRMALPLAATDVDGDSLTYAFAFPLTTTNPFSTSNTLCNQLPTPLHPYQFPNDVRRAGTYRLNGQTGLLIWDVPVEVGQYAVALIVSEWRAGSLLSQTQQELTLTVLDRGGSPVIPPAYEPAQLALITALPDVDGAGMSLQISPNPVVGEAIQATFLVGQAQAATMELLDSQGRIYKTVHLDQPSREHQFSFDLAGKPAGLYLIRAKSGGQQVVRKVLKL